MFLDGAHKADFLHKHKKRLRKYGQNPKKGTVFDYFNGYIGNIHLLFWLITYGKGNLVNFKT